MPNFKENKSSAMRKSAYKMKGNPMQRNYGIGASPVMKDEKDKKSVEKKPVVNAPVENDPMYGSLDDTGTQIVGKDGEWVKGANFASVYNAAKKDGVLSGGPE